MFGLLRYAFRFFACKGTAFVLFWQETCWFLLVLLLSVTKSINNFSPYLEVLRIPCTSKEELLMDNGRHTKKRSPAK